TNNSCNGLNRVYRSSASAATWTPLSASFHGMIDLPGTIINISVPARQSNGLRVYAIVSGVDVNQQIWQFSEHAVATWNNASGNLPTGLGLQVDTVAQHPSDIN